jgi:hypothetical protein
MLPWILVMLRQTSAAACWAVGKSGGGDLEWEWACVKSGKQSSRSGRADENRGRSPGLYQIMLSMSRYKLEGESSEEIYRDNVGNRSKPHAGVVELRDGVADATVKECKTRQYLYAWSTLSALILRQRTHTGASMNREGIEGGNAD